MILGTDMSLKECIKEGYLMMQYDARKKFDRSIEYNIFNYLPHYILEELSETGTVRVNGINDTENRCLNAWYSFDELFELYNENKKGIDSFSGTYKFVDFDKPSYRDFLNLADDIAGYSGL